MSSESVLRLLTFGGLRVMHDERELGGALVQPRRLAILAVLARADARGVSRDRLISMFWPAEEEERARRALTQAVYSLRRDLQHEDAIEGTQELSLNRDVIQSDVGEFAALLKQGRLAEAAALYKGGFLDGFHLVGVPEFERWAEDERTAVAREYARAVEQLAQMATQDGDRAGAVTWWRALTTLDPLNAAHAVGYMEALDAIGEREAAIKHARVYEVLRGQELELPPDEEVRGLAERLRTAGLREKQELPETREAVLRGLSEGQLSVGVGEVPAATAEPVAAAPSAPAAVEVRGAAAPVAPAATAAPVAAPRRRVGGVFIVLAAVVLVAIVAGVWRSSSRALGSLRASNTRRITSDAGLELDPVLSPDGRFVAYAGGDEGSLRIFVRQLDGEQAIMVSGKLGGEHRRPRWSPDGQQLLFQAQRGIWMVPALGGDVREVVPAPALPALRADYPAWSHDGSELAWVTNDTVYARAIGGGAVRAVGLLPGAHSLVWSPDGQWFAAASGNAGFVYGATTNATVPTSIGNIAGSAIVVMRATGGEPVPVADASALNTSPEWLGASNRLGFVSNRDGQRDLYAVELGTDGTPVASAVRLTTGLDLHTFSTSADGHVMAYTVFRQSANVWSLWLPNGTVASVRDARAVTSGTQTVEAMDISPDGRWLAFDSDRGGAQDIFKQAADGTGEAERLAVSEEDDFQPVWSPDGREIAFYALRADGYRRAATVSANGGPVHWVGDRNAQVDEASPTWSADGRRLLFFRILPGGPHMFDTERRADSSWSAPRPLMAAGGILPRESPTGSGVLFFSRRDELSLLPAGTSTPRVLLHEDGRDGVIPIYARWLPGGRSVLVKGRSLSGELGLWDVPVTGGAAQLRVRFDDVRRPSARHDFATDGRRVFFTRADRTADIWTLELR